MSTTWILFVFFFSLAILLFGIIKLKMNSGIMMLILGVYDRRHR